MVLSGHGFDLDTLAEQFAVGDPRVVKDHDRYLLESTVFTDLAPDHGEMLSRAKTTLAQMNGAALLTASSHRPVTASGQIVGPDKREHAVVVVDSIAVRSKVSAALVTTGDQQPLPPPPPPGQVTLATAAGNADAEAALRLLGTPPLDWVNLYRILDFVGHAKGGIQGIVTSGYASERELKCFKHTANSHDATGDDSRHGALNQEPPKDPMTIEEARTLIRSVVRQWLAP